jgi:hypothetical protein
MCTLAPAKLKRRPCSGIWKRRIHSLHFNGGTCRILVEYDRLKLWHCHGSANAVRLKFIADYNRRFARR